MSDDVPKSMADPDAGLMQAFKGGDDAAFGTLVKRHSPALVNFFYFQCRDHELAEDCCQEVWVKLFRSRSDYSPAARFRTYLFRVARNHWIDVYRSLARRVTETPLSSSDVEDEGTSLLDRIAAVTERPDGPLEKAELADIVAAALARLPDTMREVFVLGELEGLPYSEIAEVLEIPEGTVKSRMFNAVRRLREHLTRTLPGGVG